MGLFDRFENRDKKVTRPVSEEAINSGIDNNPADNEPQAIRTVYALSKFVGSVMMFTGTREQAAMPNFFQFCYAIQSFVPQLIMKLCDMEELRVSDLYLSSRFKDYVDPAHDLDTYLSNCGIIAYEEEFERAGREITFPGGKLNISINLPVQFQTMIETSKMAVVQSLLFYRETPDEYQKDWLKNNLISPILAVCLLLQVNTIHIQNQRAVMFIPQSQLNGRIETSLSFIDHISPNKKLMVYPTILNIMFIANDSGNVALGKTNLGGQEGVIVSTGGEDGASAIDTVVDNYLAGL